MILYNEALRDTIQHNHTHNKAEPCCAPSKAGDSGVGVGVGGGGGAHERREDGESILEIMADSGQRMTATEKTRAAPPPATPGGGPMNIYICILFML